MGNAALCADRVTFTIVSVNAVKMLMLKSAVVHFPECSKTCRTGLLDLPVCVCLTAEVYIGMSKPAEASACTQEAANLFPTSHNVLYTKGQIAELRGNIDEAKRWYEEALSINPTHVKTMQRLVHAPNTH